MLISQADVARLTDEQVKIMALELNDVAANTPGAMGEFCANLAGALVRVVRERRVALAVVEMDVINGDGEGALVEPGDDPVADAISELRERPTGWWWEQ